MRALVAGERTVSVLVSVESAEMSVVGFLMEQEGEEESTVLLYSRAVSVRPSVL